MQASSLAPPPNESRRSASSFWVASKVEDVHSGASPPKGGICTHHGASGIQRDGAHLFPVCLQKDCGCTQLCVATQKRHYTHHASRRLPRSCICAHIFLCRLQRSAYAHSKASTIRQYTYISFPCAAPPQKGVAYGRSSVFVAPEELPR